MTSSENTQDIKPQYTAGDEVSIMRGLDRGKTATVLGVDEANSKYNVKFTDGSFAVVNFVNVKAPTEGQVSTGKLVNLARQATDLDSFIALLAGNVDGFAKAYDSAE